MGRHAAKTRLATVGALALALALAFSAGCGGAPGTQAGASGRPAAEAGGKGKVGTAAPSFALPDLEGATVSSESLRGKVVILDFWATWCPPCREEVPHLVRLQSKYRDQGLEIVGVSLDAGGVRDVAPFADEYDVNYTMLIGDESVAKAYDNVTFLPTTFLLDRQGKIGRKFVGYTAPEVFEQAVLPLLATS
jgi:peroxiredoxin